MKTENLLLPEPLIHILEQITMPHLSANRDDMSQVLSMHMLQLHVRPTDWRNSGTGVKQAGQTAAAAGTEAHASDQNLCQSVQSYGKGIILWKKRCKCKASLRVSPFYFIFPTQTDSSGKSSIPLHFSYGTDTTFFLISFFFLVLKKKKGRCLGFGTITYQFNSQTFMNKTMHRSQDHTHLEEPLKKVLHLL